MTVQVNIAKAKATLSELVARAEAGEEVVLMRNGKPVVTLTPTLAPASRGHRRIGAWAHLGPMEDPDMFSQPDPEMAELAESADEDHVYRP